LLDDEFKDLDGGDLPSEPLSNLLPLLALNSSELNEPIVVQKSLDPDAESDCALADFATPSTELFA
jgi:hypothetical protein